jgi:hypothetical protein
LVQFGSEPERITLWRDDTTAALRLLNVLEECRPMSAAQAEGWRRRTAGWAGFDVAEMEAPRGVNGDATRRAAVECVRDDPMAAISLFSDSTADCRINTQLLHQER